LVLHFEDVFAYPNLSTSHILYLNGTKMKTLDINSKFYNVLSKNSKYYLAMMKHGTVMFYDDNVSLTNNTTMTHSGTKFITTFFNNNTHDALYVIVIHKPPKKQLSYFNYMYETFIYKMPSNCPIVTIEDGNINLLTNTIQSTTLQTFMKK
jgi:hypothetical protein